MKINNLKIKAKAYYSHTKGVISAIIYSALYMAFLQIYLKNKDDNRFLSGIAFCGAIVTGFFLLRAIKRLLQKKYKDFFGKIDKEIDKLKNLLKKMRKNIASKFGLKRLRMFLKGKDKMEFVFGEIRRKNKQEKDKKKRQKLPKWADLNNNRERVRYIYTVFLMRQNKFGYRVEPAMTPTDLSKLYAENDDQRRLFECYNEIRYEDVNVPVSGSVVKELLPTIKSVK